jgi:hypothetical protein
LEMEAGSASTSASSSAKPSSLSERVRTKSSSIGAIIASLWWVGSGANVGCVYRKSGDGADR